MRFNLKIIKKKFENVDSDVNGLRQMSLTKSGMPIKQLSLHGELTMPTNQYKNEVQKMNDEEPESDHYNTFKRFNNLIMFLGAIVGLNMNAKWKYNNATRWTKYLLVFSTAIAIYSNLLVITQPLKLIQVFSLFGVIVPVSVYCLYKCLIMLNIKHLRHF